MITSAKAIAKHVAETSGKATLKFPLDEPLPLDLIAKVVRAKLRLATASKTC
jgi:uncharacterized protein YdhG (YjbR/CyaY superfamily)